MNTPSPLIIGFGSRARVGKDHACLQIAKQYPRTSRQEAFANALKWDLQRLLGPQGIDVWTTDPKLKEVLRPLFVTYGTGFWRRLNPNHWVERLFKHIDEDLPALYQNPGDQLKLILISDVRFENEVQAIKDRGGFYVEVENKNIPYANADEAYHSPRCAALADFIVHNTYDPAFPGQPDQTFDREVLGLVEGLLIAHEEPVPYP